MVKLANMASNQKPGDRRGRKPANSGTSAAPAADQAKRPRGRPRKDAGQDQTLALDDVTVDAGSQGATGAAPEAPASAQSAEEINGIKIEVMSLPVRGGRTQGAERFPFGELGVSVRDKEGNIIGPSFFFHSVEDATYESMLATARKRHKNVVFHARKTEEGGVKGMRVWKTAKS
jgi:hypothetical protein